MNHSLKNTDIGAISKSIRKAQGGSQGGSVCLNLAAKDLRSILTRPGGPPEPPHLHLPTAYNTGVFPLPVDISITHNTPTESVTSSKCKRGTHPLRKSLVHLCAAKEFQNSQFCAF